MILSPIKKGRYSHIPALFVDVSAQLQKQRHHPRCVDYYKNTYPSPWITQNTTKYSAMPFRNCLISNPPVLVLATPIRASRTGGA